MSDHLTCSKTFGDASGSKYVRVVNMARLYMQGLHIVLNMCEYGSIIPQYASISLNVSQHD